MTVSVQAICGSLLNFMAIVCILYSVSPFPPLMAFIQLLYHSFIGHSIYMPESNQPFSLYKIYCVILNCLGTHVHMGLSNIKFHTFYDIIIVIIIIIIIIINIFPAS